MSDHFSRKPKVVGANAARLRLSREERFLIARIDGQLTLADLGSVTGLGAERVGDLVAKLQGEGAVHLAEAPKPEVSMRLIRRAPPPPKDDYVPPPPPPPEPQPEPEPEAEPEPEPEPEPAPVAAEKPVLDDELPEPMPALAEAFEEEEALAPDETEPDAPVADASDKEEKEDKDDVAARAIAEGNYRQLYESVWHKQPLDVRMSTAREIRGADLLALCFDADIKVINAILENTACNLEHVRLIATHHRTGVGLELLARRSDWIRDGLVERRLFRNPMLPELVLNRLVNSKLLLPTYKLAIDRDIPETTRIKLRGFLRKKWGAAPPEQRAELLLRTEGRCLILMTGCTFDAKTTGILCGRPINSVMFVQSIAKFGAAPPGLLAHLIKQPFVRKNMPLKKMLLAHPNMPGDVKRNI